MTKSQIIKILHQMGIRKASKGTKTVSLPHLRTYQLFNLMCEKMKDYQYRVTADLHDGYPFADFVVVCDPWDVEDFATQLLHEVLNEPHGTIVSITLEPVQ